jgi:hypothetical protein
MCKRATDACAACTRCVACLHQTSGIVWSVIYLAILFLLVDLYIMAYGLTFPNPRALAVAGQAMLRGSRIAP